MDPPVAKISRKCLVWFKSKVEITIFKLKPLKHCPFLAQNKTSETNVAPQALSGWTDGANYFHLDLNRIRTLARQFALCICLYYLEKKARLYEQEGRIGQCQQQITQDISSSSSSTTLPPAPACIVIAHSKQHTAHSSVCNIAMHTVLYKQHTGEKTRSLPFAFRHRTECSIIRIL